MYTLQYRSKLCALKEVPPTYSEATGELVASLTGNDFTYELKIYNLKNKIISAGFYDAPVRCIGQKIKEIYIGDLDSISGKWTSDDSVDPLTEIFVQKLKENKIYVNICTTEYPNGEIRSQVVRI